MMKSNLTCAGIAIFVGAAFLSGFLYAIIAKVAYEPTPATVLSCSATEYPCQNKICIKIELSLTTNRTIDGKIFPKNLALVYQSVDLSKKCPGSSTVTVWRDTSFQNYCLEDYDSTCTRPFGFIILATASSLLVAVGLFYLALEFCKKHSRITQDEIELESTQNIEKDEVPD